MNKIYRLMSVVVVFALTFGSYLSVSALTISPNTYYVAVAGNDANACTSAAPCKTFTRAISLAQPGDTVHFLPGTYNQQLIISKSSIIVEGDGAVISTSAQNGISVASTAQNVTVRGFTVTGTKSHAIFIEGNFVTVENNIVHDAITENGVYPNCGAFPTQWGSAIKTQRGISNATIRGNQVYHTCGEGIASTMAHDVIISGNTVYDNFQVNIYVDNSYNVSVTNNTVDCAKMANKPTGITMGEESYSGWGAQLRDVIISGNVVKNCWVGVMAFASDVGGTLTNVTISSNFIPSGLPTGVAVALDNSKNSNVLISKNTYYNQPWIRSTAGVTLSENVVGTQGGSPAPVSSTPTSLPTITSTVPATFTSTPVPSTPTATPTASPVPASPTATATVTMPTVVVTVSLEPALPTVTASPMPVEPTATASPIPVEPTITASPMPVEPTVTASPIPVEPTVTLTSEPPITVDPITQPALETIYDDKDNAFVYSAGWEDVSRKQAYNGSFKQTTRRNSFVTFAFTGQSFSILYKGGPSFRKMEVYVDDVLVGTINEKTYRPSFQQRWDYAGQLVPGTHTLKLAFVTPNRSDKTYGSIDAVIVR